VLSVVPATLSEDQLYDMLQMADAVAIMKVGRHLEKVRRVLDDLGMTAKAAYVERATLPNQKAVPLARLDAKEAPYFSMILVYRGGELWY
jgi:precorrin-2/cobalt-factor-2 C20-methyltransferase